MFCRRELASAIASSGLTSPMRGFTQISSSLDFVLAFEYLQRSVPNCVFFCSTGVPNVPMLCVHFSNVLGFEVLSHVVDLRSWATLSHISRGFASLVKAEAQRCSSNMCHLDLLFPTEATLLVLASLPSLDGETRWSSSSDLLLRYLDLPLFVVRVV